jgi:hypothetical protein
VNGRKPFRDAVYDWVAAVAADAGTEMPVTWIPDNGPRPEPPFIALSIAGVRRQGMPWKSGIKTASADDEGEQLVLHDEKYSLTLHGIGHESFDMVAAVYDSIYGEKYRAMLAREGLVIPYAENILDVSTVIDNETEAHEVFDFFITRTRVVIDRPGTIERTIISAPGLPVGTIDIRR